MPARPWYLDIPNMSGVTPDLAAQAVAAQQALAPAPGPVDPASVVRPTPDMPVGRPPRYQQSPGAGGAGDRYDPRARAYAKMRLLQAVRMGHIPRYLPEWDKDPAAAWRGISSIMAKQGYFNRRRGVNPRNVVQ